MVNQGLCIGRSSVVMYWQAEFKGVLWSKDLKLLVQGSVNYEGLKKLLRIKKSQEWIKYRKQILA